MWTARIGLLGLALLGAGCRASRSATTAPSPEQNAAAEAPGRPAVKVEIDNQNYSDMSIYLINGGMRMLVGSAPGLSKTTLALPAGAVGGNGWKVRLLADPIGGAPVIRTPSLLVAPGENVYWTIGSDPATSHATAG